LKIEEWLLAWYQPRKEIKTTRATMKIETKNRKKAMAGFRQISNQEQMRQQMHEIVQSGTRALNELTLELGRQLAEFILYSEREERAGPDYQPRKEGLYKWASEPGSVYLGGRKVEVERPRLRRDDQEVSLKSYQAMRQSQGFSEQLLGQSLAGLSARRYRETLVNAAEAFGVSPSAVSERLVEATTEKLKAFRERRQEDFAPFAVFLDTVHRGGVAFVVALGLDINGQKRVLGFWEGATENAEVAQTLLADLEQRGLRLSAKVLFIIDGGKGLAKTLKDRYGRKLLVQRCTIHKDRNLQAHLPKKYRQEAHRRFGLALEQNDYKEAEKLLRELEKWLREINESAADSLLEAFNELLTLHRLQVPALLRKTLHSTNPIESLFSRVRSCEKNIKRYRNSKMAQRWLASVLLYAEKSFRTVKGVDQIQSVRENIEKEHLSNAAN
jgi:putative transposase